MMNFQNLMNNLNMDMEMNQWIYYKVYYLMFVP